MIRLLTLLLMMLVLSEPVFADVAGKLSSATRLFLRSQRSAKLLPSAQPVMVPVFVAGDNGLEDDVKQAGGMVGVRLGGFVTAMLPVAGIESLSRSVNVKQIDVSRKVHLLCDSDRTLTRTAQVLSGTGLPQAYDGSGIVLGVVDSGFDYNHPVFRRDDGSTRIVNVYMADDTDGPSAVLDGQILPGSLYDSVQVSQLTCDDASTSHGTHVAGIAGGTLWGNYGGMAPGADFFLAALPGTTLTEVNIVNACYLIARYAQSVGKPCVINMSMGNHDGPHDGTGFMALAFDDIAKIGHTAIVVSAGNEGGSKLYAHKSLADGEPLSTVLASVANSLTAQLNAWNQDTAALQTGLLVVSRNSKQILYQSQHFATDTLIDCEADSTLSQFLSGTVNIAMGHNAVSGKAEVLLDISASMKSSDYRLAFSIFGNNNADVHLWECSGTVNLDSYDMPGFMSGNDSCSISDMATGQLTISVGSYVGRQKHRNMSGTLVFDTSLPVGSLSNFSSWGTELSGNVHPVIVAPGQAVISSLNSYASTRSQVQSQEMDGRTYYWGTMSGTSMSAPCVAGIVALVMQANPGLTAYQVRQLIQTSAIRDSIVIANPALWGGGKVDALAAVSAALTLSVSAVQNPSMRLLVSPCAITVQGIMAGKVTVSMYSLTGQRVLSQTLTEQANTVALSGLASGVYLVKVMGQGSVVTSKIVKD